MSGLAAVRKVPMGHFAKVIPGFQGNVLDALPPNSRIFDLSDLEHPLDKLHPMLGPEIVRSLVSGMVTKWKEGAWSRVLPGHYRARAATERSVGPLIFA